MWEWVKFKIERVVGGVKIQKRLQNQNQKTKNFGKEPDGTPVRLGDALDERRHMEATRPMGD